ncbi:MAG: general secretion pathway protein GspB [Gammaproteobacteria bacterium]|nr:general secretion pathway protein GspB [Gammaproteobacteria bacterium]
MSYILEALRRAERERRAGQTSALEQVAVAPLGPPATHRRWPGRTLIAALAALFLLGAAWWWHARQRAAAPPQLTPAESPAPAAAGSTAAPGATAIAAAAAPARQPPPLTRAGPVIIAGAGHISTLDDLVPPHPAPPPSERAPGAARERTAGVGTAAPGAAHTPPSAVTDNNTAPGAATSGSAGAGTIATSPAAPPAIAPRSAQSAPDVANGATSAPGLQALQQMPESYRAGFPPLTVQVHVYDTDIHKRWLLIDGHRYTEGDSLPSGLVIYRIVPEGIVFDWKGQRVLYSLNR